MVYTVVFRLPSQLPLLLTQPELPLHAGEDVLDEYCTLLGYFAAGSPEKAQFSATYRRKLLVTHVLAGKHRFNVQPSILYSNI